MKSLFTSKKAALAFFGVVFLSIVPGLFILGIVKDVSRSLQSVSDKETAATRFYRENYPSDYGMTVYVSIPDRNLEQWSRNLRNLHKGLEQVAYRVESLINARYSQQQIFDDGEAGSYVGDFIPIGQEIDQDFMAKAKKDNLFDEVLISQFSDGSWWAIVNVIAQGPIEKGGEIYNFDAVAFNSAVSEVVEKHRDNFTKVIDVGEPAISADISKQIQVSTNYMGLSLVLMVMLVWLHVWYFGKGLIIGVLAGCNGVFGLLFAWAAMGYCGVERSPISDIMSQMLIPLGVANVIHTHGYCKQLQKDGKVSFGFFFQAASLSFVVAMATTAVGFGMSGISYYPAMRHFGGFGVIGILGCLFTTLFFVFPIMSGMQFDDRPSGIVRILRLMLGRFITEFIILPPRQLVPVMMAITVLISVGFSWLLVNYTPADYLPDSNPEKMEFSYIRGEDPIYYVVIVAKGAPPEMDEEYGSVFEPVVLQTIHDYGQELKHKFTGLRPIDTWEQLIRIWQDAKVPIADTKLEVTSELGVSFSDPDDHELYFVKGEHYQVFNDQGEVVDVVKEPSSVVLTLKVPYKGSAEHRRLLQTLPSLEEALNSYGISFKVVGRTHGYFRAGDGIVASSDWSALWSFLILTAMFAFLLKRRVRLTVAAMIANALPIALGVAVLGLLNIDRGISTSITIPIGLCIVVDDTVHFLLRYYKLRNSGVEPNEAVRLTLQDRWEQILVTSVVIVVGFIPMAFAPLKSFAEFDILMAVIIGFALFGDLVLLPSLLVLEEMRFSWSPAATKAKEAMKGSTSTHQITH